MSDIAQIVSRAESLVNDLQLECVTQWKADNPGGKAVGHLPVYIPREILHAAGVLPVGVLGGGDQTEIVRGDAYFQSYICHIPRSVIELGLNGSYDALDGMIFPSICDVIRNLSGMWQILFPDRYVHYLDVPQNFDETLGGEFYEKILRTLTGDMQRMSGNTVTDEDLWHSIALYNENRALIARAYQLRSEQPWLVPTLELYLVVRAGYLLPVEAHNQLLTDYMAAATQSNRQPMDMARVAIVGCFCEQPPLGMIKTLERSGCYVVADDFILGARFIEGPIERGGEPLAALARAFLKQGVACQSMYLAEGKKGQVLVDAVKASGAEGVLFAAPSFCDPALLDQPMTQAAVTEAGIPSTAFKYAENTGQFQVIREQTGTFADSIKIWSDA